MLSKCNETTDNKIREYTLAVIIPAYNSKMYLEQCVQSVIEQPCDDLLVIVIDDGSTDATGLIADLIADDNSRVFVIHKENGGVSSARNAGIEFCHDLNPKYVAFLDSDDVWVKDFYTDEIRNQIILQGKDLYQFSFYCGNQSLTRGKYNHIVGEQVSVPRFLPYFCSLIYKFSAVGSIRFPVGIKAQEDEAFKFLYLCTIDSWAAFDKPIFIYRSNYQSISHNSKFNVSEKYLKHIVPAWNWVEMELSYRNNDGKRDKDIQICQTMKKTFLAEYVEMACRYGVPIKCILKNVEKSRYIDILNDKTVWLDKKRVKLWNNFCKMPHTVWMWCRVYNLFITLAIFMRNIPIVQTLRYPIKFCKETGK